ncbi:MAG: PKD domain-containing protein, partial [bacterium]
MKVRMYFLALLTLAALTFQCGIFEPEDSSGSLRITIVQETAKSKKSQLMASLASVQCIVKKGAETVYNQNLQRQGSGFHGEITGLDPANNYSVQLNGKNDRGQTISVGSRSPVAVNPGKDTYVSITMSKVPVYTLNVSVNPPDSGNVSRNPNKTKYNDDEVVQLTAVAADSNYQFNHWQGDLTGSDNPATIIMNGDKNITAYFIEKEETVSKPNTPSGQSSGKVGENLSFSTGGSSSNKGHSVEYHFDWGDGSTSNWGSPTQTHTYTVVGSYSVMAQARCQTHTSIVSSWSSGLPVTISGHTLTTNVSPSGSGSVSRNPNKSEYNHNEVVQLRADANSGYKFDRWGGDLSGSSNPVNLTMNDNKSVTAYF